MQNIVDEIIGQQRIIATQIYTVLHAKIGKIKPDC